MKLVNDVFVYDKTDWLNERLISEMKQGVTYHASFDRPRSKKHHRWFFALMGLVQKAYPDKFSSLDVLLYALKDVTNLTELAMNPITGKMMAKVGSISFEKMNQDDFFDWSARAILALNEFIGDDVVTIFMPDNVKEKPKLITAMNKHREEK
jgi:hypothetical protein